MGKNLTALFRPYELLGKRPHSIPVLPTCNDLYIRFVLAYKTH